MKLFAALPYVELAHEKSIQLGPVLFWPISRYASHIDPKDHEEFRQKIHSTEGIDTCASIDEKIGLEEREMVLIEALYLLYFICVFRNIYHFTEVPPFDAVRSIINLSDKKNWDIAPFTLDKKNFLCISYLEEEIGEGLSKAFNSAYIHANESSAFSKRLLRAIRFFIDRYIPRLLHIGSDQDSFKKGIYEPEDFLTLSMSFEALFELNHHHPAADFKQKLRPLLHLKYSRPLELFWSWIEQFYEARYAIVHGKIHHARPFTANTNFSVPLLTIASQLFIYSVYYSLFSHHLVHALEVNSALPPDFKWIHPERVLQFFWTEPHLLNKIHHLLIQCKEHPMLTDLKSEIYFLTRLFVSMQEMREKGELEDIIFIPSSLPEVELEISSILSLSSELPLPEVFVDSMLKRMSIK